MPASNMKTRIGVAVAHRGRPPRLAFYVCIYLGVSLPVIGIGVLAVATTLFTAVTTLAIVTGGAALAVAAWHLRHRDRLTARPAAGPERERAPAGGPAGRPRG